MNALRAGMLITILGMVLFTGANLIQALDSDQIEESVEWCEDRGGEVYNSNSINHGGLHCELENGTVVHLSEVNTTASDSFSEGSE